MPNIYLILSILQFICLPNRSSNKSAPSPNSIAPSAPLSPHPALLSDIRLGVSIAISRGNFQFSTRAVRGSKKNEANQNQKTNLPAGNETKVCSLLYSDAAGNVDTRWQLKPEQEQEPQLRLQTRLRSGQKYGSVLSMAVTMATSQRTPRHLLQLPAACQRARLAPCSSPPLPPLPLQPYSCRGFYLKTILFALWICGA